MMPGARKRARGPVRSRWLQGSEPLEPRRALAVTATAPIDSFVMPIGSAAQLVVVGQPASPVSAQSGDFDGDLGDDFAWIDSTGGVWVNRSLGVASGTAPQLWGRLPSDVRWESITVRDFTGDGRADIAARNARNGNWRLLKSDGVRFSDPQRFGNWSPGVAWEHVVAGDFDGNGSADLAARDPASGEWWVSRSTDLGFTPTRFGARSVPWSECFVGDFNADGRSDLAGRNPATGRWRVFTSEGGRFASGRVFGTWATDVPWADATIGDVDADGRSDLLGRNPTTGEWLVSRSTGTAFTTSTFGGFANPQTWGQFVAGDFNCDGKTDIAGRNQATGRWRLLASTGTRFDRPRVIGSGSLLIGSGTSGITSSAAAASGGGRTVGWIDNGNASATGFAFAAAGDTNLDWQVDIVDAASFLAGGKFDSGTPASWNQGDFTYDGVVDILNAADFHHS